MDTNLHLIDVVIPETNEYKSKPRIIPERFNSITQPLHYSLLPINFAPTNIRDYY